MSDANEARSPYRDLRLSRFCLPVKRLPLFFFLSLAGAAGAAFVAACSSDADTGGTDAPDATADTTVDPSDARRDAPAGNDGGTKDGGNCTAVKGPCDIVLQDCPDSKGQKQECVVTESN